MNCPMCGELWNAVTCGVCGWREPRGITLFCPRCGSGPCINASDGDGQECPDCGRPFTPAEKEQMG